MKLEFVIDKHIVNLSTEGFIHQKYKKTKMFFFLLPLALVLCIVTGLQLILSPHMTAETQGNKGKNSAQKPGMTRGI